MSARSRIEVSPPSIQAIVDERTANLEMPLIGITTDGVVRPGLFTLGSSWNSTEAIRDAVAKFLDALSPQHRPRAQFAMDSREWRTWTNVHPNYFRHGIILEELPLPTRNLALDILKATLSARGYIQARNIMRINEFIAELSGRPDEFGEWPYFVSIFGDPANGEPWGWQIDGHHLNINCAVFDGQIAMTPTFMGSEPCKITCGPLAGTTMFALEEQGGLELIRSLNVDQQAQAILRPSLHPDDLPIQLQNPFDGRMQAGAGLDNIIVPYQGIVGADLSDGQRSLLRAVLATYVKRSAGGHAEVKIVELYSHLNETWFSWYGNTDDSSPFYYRIHSPVVLIEFDHHPGVIFDNDIPTRNHIHTLVRTPNGGDYGADLLRQHYARFDHSSGVHKLRQH
jgi:Protein of unknown function (DUF3500)